MSNINFDTAKTQDEKVLDSAISVLEHTIPEQITDAMGDYVKVINLIESSSDERIRSLLPDIKDLYIYPERQIHNEFMKKIHGVKELIQEERIDSVIKTNTTTKSDLGGFSITRDKIIYIACIALLLYFWRKYAAT